MLLRLYNAQPGPRVTGNIFHAQPAVLGVQNPSRGSTVWPALSILAGLALTL